MAVENLAKSVVDDNESGLLSEIKTVYVDPAKSREFICGADCGSTQTRIKLMPMELAGADDISNWFEIGVVIPSKSKPVSTSKTLKPRSVRLHDNMDSLFSINAGNSVRLVRGSKFDDVEMAEKEFYAASKKINSDVLKYNIADGIGYALAQHYGVSGEAAPGQIKCRLTLALPPDDILERDIEKFRAEFKRFTWSLPGRTKASIEITIADIAIYSEPEAQIKAHYTFSDEDALLLESGGRNSAPVIFKNGGVIDVGQKSIEQSGSKLLDRIGNAYVAQYGGKLPQVRYLEQAVRTGKMKSGNTYVDITELVKQCKDEVAEDLFQKLQSDVLSKQSVVSLDTLNVVLLSGRVYFGGDYRYSVADKLQQLIKSVSPHTDVVVLGDNLIPQGLILLYLLEYVYG
ncbi:hypothetical protein AGMMS49975_10070 [Clostridia bacterium]|nr:hypothetical protein AGMMS49975_10070 [Clostridia bacterium]